MSTAPSLTAGPGSVHDDGIPAGGSRDQAHPAGGPDWPGPPADQPGDRPGPAADTGPERPATVPRGGRSVRSWPLLVLAAPAAVAVWSGWVGIGQMTGFGEIRPLPGIWTSLHIDTAVSLPVGVEAYAASALRAWLTSSPAASDRTRRFARWSAIAALVLGMAGQVAYHLLAQAGMTRAPWEVTTLVSCLPVLVLGLGSPAPRRHCGRQRGRRRHRARPRHPAGAERAARTARTSPRESGPMAQAPTAAACPPPAGRGSYGS
jgi:hypothetical protein